jgi:hypothetical protein
MNKESFVQETAHAILLLIYTCMVYGLYNWGFYPGITFKPCLCGCAIFYLAVRFAKYIWKN